MLIKKDKDLLKKVDLEVLLKMETMEEVADYFIKEVPLFHSKRDITLFLVEYTAKALTNDNGECPIRYYGEGEELEEKVLEKEDGEENLTDVYIKARLNNITPQ